jgi:hypothetical protein
MVAGLLLIYKPENTVSASWKGTTRPFAGLVPAYYWDYPMICHSFIQPIGRMNDRIQLSSPHFPTQEGSIPKKSGMVE